MGRDAQLRNSLPDVALTLFVSIPSGAADIVDARACVSPAMMGEFSVRLSSGETYRNGAAAHSYFGWSHNLNMYMKSVRNSCTSKLTLLNSWTWAM